jgi:predicted Ser/Thr protein kinase
MADLRTCPQCGGEIPADAPEGLCPKCLIQAGFESQALSAGSDAAATESHAGRPAPSFIPPTPAELADRFPQLEILELLGQGGMGAVYKARQKGLDRLVAVKILPPEAGADPAFAERFAREARAMARLSHPHITNVYDFGQLGGQFFLVMEYVDGVNLRQAIRSGSIAPKTALEIVTQVCDALQYAHDEGVVHRDIKPENILIDRRGRVKIADFGLAKLLGADGAAAGLTGTHQVMGTLRYMAPEQMEGSRHVDHRADIYSLGVVFYELLTGEVPMGRFQPPSAKVEVDVRIDEVVLKSLEREPDRRYQRASEVKSDVDAVTQSEGSTKSTTQASAESDIDRLIRTMVRDNKGLGAIRAYRAATGAGLSEALAAVRKVAAAERVPLQRLSSQRRLIEIALTSLAMVFVVSLGAPEDYLIFKLFALIAYVVLLIGHGVGARRDRMLRLQAAPGHVDGPTATKERGRASASSVEAAQALALGSPLARFGLLVAVGIAAALGLGFFWQSHNDAADKNAISPAAPGEATPESDSELAAFWQLGRDLEAAFKQNDFDAVKTIAEGYLDAAKKFPDDWNYGNAIHDANAMLGLAALVDGRMDQAKERLRAAGKATATPQLVSFGPNLKLAAALLALDERQTVLDYLADSKSFWTNHEQVERLTKAIERNTTPWEFRAALDTPLVGSWVAEQAPDADAPGDLVEFAADGRLEPDVYGKRASTFRREGAKVFIADPEAPDKREQDDVFELKNDRLMMSGGEDLPFMLPTDGLRRTAPVDPPKVLAGKWEGTMKFLGVGEGRLAWTFDSDDSGQCTMEIRAPTGVSLRYAPIGDRVVYRFSDSRIAALAKTFVRGNVGAILKSTPWRVDGDVLTIDEYWSPDPKGNSRRTFKRFVEPAEQNSAPQPPPSE